MAEINITITGTDEISKGLKYLNKEIQDASEPLLEASNIYYETILTNFKNKGTTFGKKWKPISKATIAIKRKLKEEGKAIAFTVPLVRTGQMRDAFTYLLVGKNKSRIINMMSYAELHQEGIGVPKRILAAVDNTRLNMVARVFTQWINRLITNYYK